MAGFVRKVHMESTVEWGPIDRFAPDLEVRVTVEAGAEPVQPMALRFLDHDGEAHVYAFSEEGKAALLKTLTGGVIVPNGSGL
jgi:hypothetical protein